jgi:ribosome recycling factor
LKKQNYYPYQTQHENQSKENIKNGKRTTEKPKEDLRKVKKTHNKRLFKIVSDLNGLENSKTKYENGINKKKPKG